MLNTFMEKYFKYGQEYPEKIAFDPLPWGHYWSYVSTTFLNGFINYVDIKAAYVLNRYHKWEDTDDPHWDKTIRIMEPPGSFNWTDFKGTKQEIYEKLCEPDRVYHSKLDNDFGDDIVILARCQDAVGWYFFWFDRDCSDSCIGRFLTDDSDDEVLASFTAWVNGLENEYSPAKPIPLHYFRGWLAG